MQVNLPRTITVYYAALIQLVLMIAAVSVSAERLPVKTYTTSDGLLRDEVNRIKQDSRGFLWFCTNDGLSRFDGYGFTNYTTDDGLPHRMVNDILETRDGVIWVATNGGLARFNPRGKRGVALRGAEVSVHRAGTAEPMFITYSPEDAPLPKPIGVLLEDAQGKLWCGSNDGLYWFEEGNGSGAFHRIGLTKEKTDVILDVSSIIQDRRGNVWIAMDLGQGLNRITLSGRVEHYAIINEGQSKGIKTLLETNDGEIWAGTSDGGLYSLVSDPIPGRPVFSRIYSKKDGLPSIWINTLYQTSDGKLWIGTTNGTATLIHDNSSTLRFQIYSEAQGLCDEATRAIGEDRDGNIWVGTTCGVKKIVRGSFVRYTESDGLSPGNVNGIFVSRTGEFFVITKQSFETQDKKSLGAAHFISYFDGNRFTGVKPNMATNGTGWGSGQIVVKDLEGQWWLPSQNGAAFRFPKTAKLEQLASIKPQAINVQDQQIFRLYEDSRGDMWISTMYEQLLLNREREAGTLHNYSIKSCGAASCFIEDNRGSLWIGFFLADKLARFRDGRMTVLPTNGEKAGGRLNSLYCDHAGRLWLASDLNGVGRVDDPGVAEQLSIVWYDRKKGLATDSIESLTEDTFGRIYVGHARGVDRIDPNTGQIKHYTAADGLPQGPILFAGRDGQGSLWFGFRGLARLTPEADKPRQAPNILLTGLRVAGERLPLSELGQEIVPELTLESSQRQVSVDFLGLGASLGEELRYQYKLEGTQTDWSEPTSQRTVDFANLAPGTYRLLIKAITAEGIESVKPAAISFTILRPIWQRWWVITPSLLLIGLAVYAAYRYRVAHLIELERVRTRIATDLHDDIGANLTLIAMASEVARLRSPKDDVQIKESLSLISDTSRELVDSMGDIVWAVNPSKDHLRDLTKKMRRFASDVFSARNISFRFQAPGDEQDIKLGVDTRREMFLIFKESVNNIARHSECSEAEIELEARAGRLLLKLKDDGKGFDVEEASDGTGLASMRKRAASLDGNLEIVSSNGKGTTVILKVPLGHRSRT